MASTQQQQRGDGSGEEAAVQHRLDDYMTNMKKRLGLEGLGLGPFLPANVLELVRQGLLQLPEDFCLERNRLESLPAEIDLLAPRLLRLLCSDNCLYALPKQLAHLTALQRLGAASPHPPPDRPSCGP